MNDIPDDTLDSVAEDAAALFDYLQDYGDISEEYNNTQRLEVHKDLKELIDRINDGGYSVSYAERKTAIRNTHWADQTPLPFTVVYYMLAQKGQEPNKLVVPKQFSLQQTPYVTCW